MAKAKRKKPVYDMNDPQDVMDFDLVCSAGLDRSKRHPRDKLNALAQMTREQRQRGGIEFLTSRKMLEGSEERDVESVAARRYDIPESFWGLGAALCEAVSDYQALWNAARPAEVVSLSERSSGGSIEQDPYNDKTMDAWSKVRRLLRREEAKLIEQFLLAADGALMSTSHFITVKSGAARLADYFDKNTLR